MPIRQSGSGSTLQAAAGNHRAQVGRRVQQTPVNQYVSVLREMLLADHAPYVIAVAQEVGYVLCEIAKNPRHTVSVARDEGASEAGRKVRQLRIAAGLSQTALARRAGMDLATSAV